MAILTILSVSVCAYVLALTSRQLLYGMNRHRTSAWISLAEAVANLGLSIALAMRIGSVGVAWGTLIPAVIGEAIALPIYTCRLLGLLVPAYYWEVLGRPLLAAIPYTLWVAWMRSHNAVQGWLSLALWLLPGLALYALGACSIALDGSERALGLSHLQRAWRQLGEGTAAGRAGT